jgi:tyrosine-protein kinase Etk/Wzc
VPAKPQKAGLSGLLGGELSSLAAGMEGGSGADAQRILAVLKSVAVSDAVIARFDLKKRYDERYQENTREELWRHCEAKVLAKPSLVQLTCEDKDPRFVQQMLAYFAEVGNEAFQRVNVSTASEEVRTMEKRVGELRAQADEAAVRMREFQEKHQIVDIDTQARAVVASAAMIQGQRLGKKMELEYARGFASADEPGAQRLRSEISVMEDALRDLEQPREIAPQATGKGARGSGMFPPALTVPALRAEYEKLYRDRKVAEATLIFALERLESARAAQARDVSTFAVLDPPTVPERRHRPKRMLILAGALVAGALAGAGREWWRSHRLARAMAR